MEDQHNYKIGELSAGVSALKDEVRSLRQDIKKLFDLLTVERIKSAQARTKLASITGGIGIVAGALGAVFKDSFFR